MFVAPHLLSHLAPQVYPNHKHLPILALKRLDDTVILIPHFPYSVIISLYELILRIYKLRISICHVDLIKHITSLLKEYEGKYTHDNTIQIFTGGSPLLSFPFVSVWPSMIIT